jgi:hypothetical protein
MCLLLLRHLLSGVKKSTVRNDCVFVTIAYLLGMSNVEQLYGKINWTPPTDPDGITDDEIREVLAALDHPIQFEDYSNMPLRPRRALNVHPTQDAQPDCFGVIYRRKNGSGHCVVQERKYSYDYIDYQKNPKGASVWKDVRDSYIEARFWIAKKL